MKRISVCLTILALIATVNANAHHSVYAEFETTKYITIEGVMKEVWFKNPHVRFYVVVTDENGQETIWDTHSHTPSTVRNAGWQPDSIPVGARISMTGNPGRNGVPALLVREATILETGQTFYTSLIPRDAEGNPIEKESIDE